MNLMSGCCPVSIRSWLRQPMTLFRKRWHSHMHLPSATSLGAGPAKDSGPGATHGHSMIMLSMICDDHTCSKGDSCAEDHDAAVALATLAAAFLLLRWRAGPTICGPGRFQTHHDWAFAQDMRICRLYIYIYIFISIYTYIYIYG